MENTCENGDQKLNIIVIGESNVGKSSIVRRFLHEQFRQDEKPTVVADTLSKSMTINDKIMSVEIWDVSGLQDYRSLVSMIFRNLNCSNESRFGLILVYDVTDIKSFDSLTKWFQQLEVTEQSGIVKTVIGNKIDLRDKIVVSMNRGQEFSRRFNAEFFETSAANDLNVRAAFDSLLTRLLNGDEDRQISCFEACTCQ